MAHDTLGWILIGTGVLDVLVGLLIVAPRVPEGSRRMVLVAVAAAAALVMGVGGLFLAGIFRG